MKHRDLNAPPAQQMADIVRSLKERAESSKTTAHGVKDLGGSGDVVWSRPDGVPVSVRDVDLELADARQRIEDAEVSLGETGTRLTDAEQAVSDAVASIDGKLDESALDDPATSGRLAASMTDVTRHLIVTDSAILNHATLIGQTVVDDINVQGKLIGKDGVFTGTVDFENVNVTGTQIVNKLAANSISADKISGGSFEGNTFRGGSFEGTAFRGGSYATSSNPANDSGVMIDPVNGIRAWDSSGQTLKIGKGENFISGRISTTKAGQPGIILTPIAGGGGGLWFTQSGEAGSSEAAIWSALDGHIHIRPKVSTPAGTVFIDGNLIANDKMTIDAALTADSLLTVNSASCAGLVLRALPTSSSAANMFRAGSGIVYTSTSSRRYKKNIADWNPAPERVLELRPRQWQHDDPENPPDLIDETWHVGFIAEEVHDLGLSRLVRYTGDGKGGWIPDGLNYDRFAAAQQIVLRKHEAEINELRERIALLEQNQEHQ